MTEDNHDSCPICYEHINNIKDVSISICNHKFHTGCIIRCNGICPLCRTNLMTGTDLHSKIKPGIYSIAEYIELLEQNNIPIESVSLDMQESIKTYYEYLDDLKILKEKKKKSEENEKEILRKQDPNKYKLFYG